MVTFPALVTLVQVPVKRLVFCGSAKPMDEDGHERRKVYVLVR